MTLVSLGKAPATPSVAAGHRKFESRLTLLRVGALWAFSDTVTAWLIASGCTLGSLTWLFCKSKVEKKWWLDIWSFGFLPNRSKLASAQWEGFSYWLVEHGCGLAREGTELDKSMVGSGPGYCKTPNSLWNHGHAVPHSEHHFKKATGLIWCYGQYPNSTLCKTRRAPCAPALLGDRNHSCIQMLKYHRVTCCSHHDDGELSEWDTLHSASAIDYNKYLIMQILKRQDSKKKKKNWQPEIKRASNKTSKIKMLVWL